MVIHGVHHPGRIRRPIKLWNGNGRGAIKAGDDVVGAERTLRKDDLVSGAKVGMSEAVDHLAGAGAGDNSVGI